MIRISEPMGWLMKLYPVKLPLYIFPGWWSSSVKSPSARVADRQPHTLAPVEYFVQAPLLGNSAKDLVGLKTYWKAPPPTKRYAVCIRAGHLGGGQS
jgi:hypothetical protein